MNTAVDSRRSSSRTRGVTLRDIAARSGISIQAVSHALSDNPQGTVKVSSATRERVRALAQQMGYRHNRAAQSLRTGKSNLLAILSFQGVDQIGNRQLHYSLHAANKTHLNPLVFHVDPANPEQIQDACGEILSSRADAVLVLNPSQAISDAHLNSLVSAGLPIASIGGNWLNSITRFNPDKIDAFEQLGLHIIESGYRQTGLLCSHISQDNIDKQYGWHAYATVEGFRSAARKASERGIEAEWYLYEIPIRTFQLFMRTSHGISTLHASGYFSAKELIENGKLPRALICQTDAWALGVLRACAEAGISVPDDLALASFENDPSSAVGTVPFTSVENPTDNTCKLALDFLLKALEQKQIPEPSIQLVPCHLVVRNSTSRIPLAPPKLETNGESILISSRIL